MIGHEFYTDPEQTEVLITCKYVCPVLYSPIEFVVQDCQVKVKFSGSHLQIEITKKISQKLFDGLNVWPNNKYILADINKILPQVNLELLNQKYHDGHILGGSFSLINISFIDVTILSNKKSKSLNWPLIFQPFEPVKKFAIRVDYMFLRDYIEAGSCYFSKNYDECIRRCVTAIENFFHKIKLSGQFRNRLNQLLIEENYLENWAPYLSILSHNVNVIYKLRNDIVHDKLRLSLDASMVCDKACGTLSYLFRNFHNDSNTNMYVKGLHAQFQTIKFIIEGPTLEELKQIAELPLDRLPQVENWEQFEKNVFESLKISDSEIQTIKLRSSFEPH